MDNAMSASVRPAVRPDAKAFEAIMRRYNTRLFRIARTILKDDAAAEDALQDAYVRAYGHMDTFRGDSELSTWLTRIVINEALMALRKRKRERTVVPFAPARDAGGSAEVKVMDIEDVRAESPSDTALRGEIRGILERRIDELPVAFRTVFVMREVEDLSVQETAECLGIPAATVRTRLFRARTLLREALERDMDSARASVFAFAGARCDRIVAGVLARISQ
jgi:RNA polymerase sigma-70 factor (ECF subfamily)